MRSVPVKVVYILFVLFCLIPYIKIIGFSSTTNQPTALFLSIIPFIFIKREKFPLLLVYLLILVIVATVFLLIVPFSFVFVRDWMNYFSFFIVTAATYKLLSLNALNFKFIFKISAYLWLFVGLVQYLFNPSFLSFLVSSSSGALIGGRGVTSLATEPGYYGLIMLSYLAIFFVTGMYRTDKLLLIVIVFQLLFLAKSTTAFIGLLLGTTMYLIIMSLRLKLRYIALSGVLFILFLSGSNFIKNYEIDNDSSRIVQVIKAFTDNPELILAFDYSTNSRFLSVVLPFYSLVDNCFLPQGFGKFSSYYGVALKDPEKKQLFVNPAIKIAKLGYPSKSESGFGKTIFEMGFLGILLIVFIVLSTFGSIMNNWYFALGICLYLSCMFMTFPLITPISSFILGCLLYEHKKFHQRAVE